MSTVAMLAGRQNRYLRRLEAARATAPERAVELQSIGCGRSLIYARLVARGVLVEHPDGRVHLDPERARIFRARRRWFVLGAVLFALLALLVAMLFGAL